VVDRQRCVLVKTSAYSTPLHPGTDAVVKTYSAYVEIWARGKCVARYERCYRKRQQILDLEHYLDVLERKPGALAGSTPLAQWRSQGRWPDSYDLLWQRMIERLGRQNGTREMISLLDPSTAIHSPRISPTERANRTNSAPLAVTASRCIRRNSAMDLWSG
jgi:hypothetical protein